ncbi:unnamed protein product [Vicia faba]|uniref:Uncharacterized protein n=1 Tax=Vicia faba TaxID=3906 RepID=A0AAV0YJJ6_VICFA|nr:unnamed protein product [Vicia faba]
MVEKGTSKKTRVFDSSDTDDEPIMFLNQKPLKMIVLVNIPTNQSKSDSIKKKASEKVNTSIKEPYVHVHEIVETVNSYVKDDYNTIGKIIDHDATTLEKYHVKPYVKSHRNDNPENKEPKVPSGRNETDDEDDDILISNIMMRIIESSTKPQEKTVAKEVENIDEETEFDEAPVVKVIKSIISIMDDEVNKKKKYVSPKTFKKNTEIMKKKFPQ